MGSALVESLLFGKGELMVAEDAEQLQKRSPFKGGLSMFLSKSDQEQKEFFIGFWGLMVGEV